MSENVSSEIDEDSFRKRFIKYTRKAFQMLPKLEQPSILDIGCGSGLPTLELARLNNGKIIGIDSDQAQLEKLNRKIVEAGLAHRVKTINCSLFEMSFPDESFDIIWAEGSIWIIGFEEGLKRWRPLLKPKGFIVIHDMIKTVTNTLENIQNYGYKLFNYFILPEDTWMTEYYQPLENRIKKLSKRYRNSDKALKALRKYHNKVNLAMRNTEEQSSAFYILQKS
jgi:ubiquinone/menaquinone biosynthesis C-methylase UbiE